MWSYSCGNQNFWILFWPKPGGQKVKYNSNQPNQNFWYFFDPTLTHLSPITTKTGTKIELHANNNANNNFQNDLYYSFKGVWYAEKGQHYHLTPFFKKFWFDPFPNSYSKKKKTLKNWRKTKAVRWGFSLQINNFQGVNWPLKMPILFTTSFFGVLYRIYFSQGLMDRHHVWYSHMWYVWECNWGIHFALILSDPKSEVLKLEKA